MSGEHVAAIHATMCRMARADQLSDGERSVLILHPHWKTLLRPSLVLVLVGGAAGRVRGGGGGARAGPRPRPPRLGGGRGRPDGGAARVRGALPALADDQ